MTPCLGCGRLVPRGTGRCGGCVDVRRLRSSYAWTQRSRQVRAEGVCARCGGPPPLEAHHLRPAASNPEQTLTGPVVALCRPCHYLEKREGA